MVENGDIITTITGEPFFWLNLGEKSNTFSYTHTADTKWGEKQWNVNPYNDMFYELTTTKEADFYLSHKDSELESTYLTLVNAKDESIVWSASNNSKKPTELTVRNVPPGTYYVISEGKEGNGVITTHIDVEVDSDIKNNYVRTKTYTYQPDNEYLDTYHYYNGLGYPVQILQKRVTPAKKDLAFLKEYDKFGRESRSWYQDYQAVKVPTKVSELSKTVLSRQL